MLIQKKYLMLEIGGDTLFKWHDGAILKSNVLSVTLNQEISYGFYGGPSERAHLLVGLKCWVEKKWDIR